MELRAFLRAFYGGVDGRGTPTPVPDAPAPIYDSHGNQVAQWSVRIDYDVVRDLLEVTYSQEPGPYHRGKRVVHNYAPEDLEDAIADVQRAARICGARRLF